jgi:hypothetical protein
MNKEKILNSPNNKTSEMLSTEVHTSLIAVDNLISDILFKYKEYESKRGTKGGFDFSSEFDQIYKMLSSFAGPNADSSIFGHSIKSISKYLSNPLCVSDGTKLNTILQLRLVIRDILNPNSKYIYRS